MACKGVIDSEDSADSLVWDCAGLELCEVVLLRLVLVALIIWRDFMGSMGGLFLLLW